MCDSFSVPLGSIISWDLGTDKEMIKHSSRQCAFFNLKVLTCFLFLHENICCGYQLEAPHRGASNEYPQHMFL